MTANQCTPDEGENVSEVSLEDYTGHGTAHARGQHFSGEFDEAVTEVMLQHLGGDGYVTFSAVYENAPAKAEVMVQLEPGVARRLGAEMIEWAERIEAES